MCAWPGYEGRELTEEELQECRDQLAALEEKREQGIRDRKVAKDTLDNTEQLKLGQAEILDAVRTGFASVHDRMDPIIAPAGSSANLRQQARVVAKPERQADKERKLLHEGLVQENRDENHGEVLVKAGSEVDQGRDLNATITVGGMRCRLVLLDRAQAWVQLLPPVNLDQLKARDADFRYSLVVMRAQHKGTTFSNLRWKDRGTQLVDGEDAKVPKQAIIRLTSGGAAGEAPRCGGGARGHRRGARRGDVREIRGGARRGDVREIRGGARRGNDREARGRGP